MKKINDNIKHIIVLIVAIIISSMISIKAATTLSSTSVYYDTSKSGGSSTVTLSTSNLPSHSHDVKASGTVSSSFTGTRTTSESTGSGYTISHTYSTRNTNTTGSHTHSVGVGGYNGWPSTWVSGYVLRWDKEIFWNQDAGASTIYYNSGAGIHINDNGNHSHTVSDYYANKISGVESHLHYYTAKGSVSSTFTGSKATSTSTGSGTSFSVQNPYTVVYMYKRTA